MEQRGFTLMELMVALAILAILAAIAWPSYTAWQENDGLKKGTMYLNSALSTARSRTIQKGVPCDCPPGVPDNTDYDCSSLLYGIHIDASNEKVGVVRLRDEGGRICTGSSAWDVLEEDGCDYDDSDNSNCEVIWLNKLNRNLKYVHVDEDKTNLKALGNKNYYLFFDKSGGIDYLDDYLDSTVDENKSAKISFKAGGKKRCVKVSESGVSEEEC